MYIAKRLEHNPIISPDIDRYWEGFAVFNMSVIKKGKTIYGFYRALSKNDPINNQHQISTIGITSSKDGRHFKDRRQLIIPTEEYDKYGCEDPRATYFEGKYYIFYTALSVYPFSAEGIKVAVAISKDLKNIEEKHLVTPFNAKAMTLFPERINGKIVVMFSAFTDVNPAKMVFAYLDKIEDLWSQTFWTKWLKNIDSFTIDLTRMKGDNVEVGAPPVKTKYGWMLFYSHIQNYYRNDGDPAPIWGIEAILLDLENPKKIIGRTKGPIIAPLEPYELVGYVSNVIFPSGAILDKDMFTVYYGAADTSICAFRINASDLLRSIHPKYSSQYYFKRFEKNPIIQPIPEHGWESVATFNPAAIDLGGKVHIFYRAFSSDNTSTIGYASSKNGLDIDERFPEPIYKARGEFESKKTLGGFSGCEDPRLTQIGKTVYMCYTAYDGINTPKVAITSISEKDLIARNWNFSMPLLITPQGIDDKDACLFSDKFKNGYFVMHRIDNSICGDYISSLDFDMEMVKKCIRILSSRRNMWDSAKVGIASPPLKTKYGWLLLYHGVSKSHNTYRVGAVLLDLKDPAIVLARSSDPVFEPEMSYEKNGFVNNVVFPCGIVVRKGMIYIYYGGADKVVGVATMKLDILLGSLVKSMKY